MEWLSRFAENVNGLLYSRSAFLFPHLDFLQYWIFRLACNLSYPRLV